MKRWKKYAAGLLMTAGLSSQAHAQLGAVPAAPAAVPGTAAAAPAPAAPQSNLWSFLCLTPEQKAACKDKFCNSALGQMLNNGLKPAGVFTGGLVPSCCPAVSPADLLKPADSAEGAAARVKADEADAKARREAVRFLGTVDCNYWPEAQEALINALRGDRNECVRLEAAFALNRGCCCTKMIIKALLISASGSDEDGFPGERSERVRGVAQAALSHCLACYTEVVPVPPEVKKGDGKEPVPLPKEGASRGEKKPATPDKLPTPVTQPATPVEFYKHVQMEPRQQIIAESQYVLAHLHPLTAQTMPVPQESSPNSVLALVQHAFGMSETTITTTIVEQPLPPAVPMKAVADVKPLSPKPELSGPAILPPAIVTKPATTPDKVASIPTKPVKVADKVAVAPAKVVADTTPLPSRAESSGPTILPPMPTKPAPVTDKIVWAPPTVPSPTTPAAQPAAMLPPVPSVVATPSGPLVPPPAPVGPSPTTPVARPMMSAPFVSPVVATPSAPAAATVVSKPSDLPVAPPSAPAAAPVVSKPSYMPSVVPMPPALATQAQTTAPTVQEYRAMHNTTPASAAPVGNGMNLTLSQVVAMLRESPHPEYRSWAADNLATVDGWTNPDVVQALAKAARTDSVASVRAASVRALGRLGCGTMPALSAVQAAKGDSDIQVRKEADLAIQLVGGIQGASLMMPSGR